jgi:hypothetical protein
MSHRLYRLLLLATLTAAPVASAQRFTEIWGDATLYTNQVMSDPLYQRWQLTMQYDCNLVLSRFGHAQWSGPRGPTTSAESRSRVSNVGRQLTRG